MNVIFKKYLRKFVIVFFDDILVYSTSMTEHISHLSQVFDILVANTFFLKQTKCAFGVDHIEYLWHIVYAGVVGPDPGKIEAIKQWPILTNVKQLRGFLGLTDY